MPDKKLYFAISADTRVASRLDSYLNNTKFVWSKGEGDGIKKETKKAVGTISCWAKIRNTPLLHENYEIMWQAELSSQAICMKVSRKLKMIAVGSDDGFLRVFLIDLNQPKTVVAKYEKEMHKGRLMDLYIDSKRKVIFTIGEDKFLRTFCIATGGIMNGKI